MISSKVTAAVVLYASQSGVPPDVLLQAASLSPAVLADPDAFVTLEEEQRLWDEAVRLTGDDALGVHVAEWVSRAPQRHDDTLSYALRSCPTLSACYTRCGRFFRSLNSGVALSLETAEGVARLVYQMSAVSRKRERQQVEALLASLVLLAREHAGASFAPLEVHFTYAEPAEVSAQERVFGAPVLYARARDQILFDSAWLERPFAQGDSELLSLLERRIDERLSRVPQDDTLLPAVRRCVVLQLPEGEPSMSCIARKLRTSPRSLQRRLAEAGTSFSDVVDAERRDLALRHLENPWMSISEVAFLLGFSTVPAFHRAFKRWTGLTPMETRRRSVSPSIK